MKPNIFILYYSKLYFYSLFRKCTVEIHKHCYFWSTIYYFLLFFVSIICKYVIEIHLLLCFRTRNFFSDRKYLKEIFLTTVESLNIYIIKMRSFIEFNKKINLYLSSLEINKIFSHINWKENIVADSLSTLESISAIEYDELSNSQINDITTSTCYSFQIYTFQWNIK